MTTNNQRRATEDQRHDETVKDSFPASDPPANSGVIGPRGTHAHNSRRAPSHQRGEEGRPKGSPTDERHATETAHNWEDEAPPGHRG